MHIFRKRKDSKSEKVSKGHSKPTTTSSSPPPQGRKSSVPYRHIPTRAAHDARKIRLPSLSINTKDLDMQQDMRTVHHAPSSSPHGGRFFSSKGKTRSRELLSQTPLSPRSKPSPQDRRTSVDGPTSPQDKHSPAYYRHIPTHAATDAFRTSAGTQLGWHRTRIDRLEEHSKRLNMALTRPGIRRFGSSSSSSSSAASIDSILCANCSGTERTLNRNCSQQHLKPRSTRSSDSDCSAVGAGKVLAFSK